MAYVSLKPERPAHAHSTPGQGRAQGGFVPDLLSRQDLARDRAGVLGINIELVGLEGVEEDLRPPQLAPVDGRHARLADQVLGDITQDHGFGEHFRADPDRGRGFVGRRVRAQRARQELGIKSLPPLRARRPGAGR